MSRFRALALSAFLLAAALALPFGMAAPTLAQRATPAPPTQQPRNASECAANVGSSVSANTVRLCDTITTTVRIEPSCPFCRGGISIVFVIPELAAGLGLRWMNTYAASMIDELKFYRTDYERDTGTPFLVQAGVVQYGESRSRPIQDMTTNLDRAKSAAQAARDGVQAGGAYANAGQQAVQLLENAERRGEAAGYRACMEIVVYFVDFTGVEDRRAALSQLQLARGMILRRAQHLYVGCVADENNGFYGCGFVGYMQENNNYYGTVFDTPQRFARQMRRDIRDVQEAHEKRPPELLKEMQLTQRLPEGLAYVAGSGVPAPAAVDVHEGQTVLRWDWIPLRDMDPKEVSYVVQPVALGDWKIEGQTNIKDLQNRLNQIPLPVQAISVTAPCILPSPTPTDTPEPTPTNTPTDTPVPTATSTPTQTPSPTPTATPQPRPVYLPLALTERCLPEQKRIDLALAIDASTSMNEPSGDGRTKIAAARDAAAILLDSLRLDVGDQAAVVAFNSAATLVQGLTSDGAALQAALDAIQLAQQTCIVCAVELAGVELFGPRHHPDHQTVLVLLTDGRSNPRPVSEAVAAADALKARGVLVFTIGLGDDVDTEALATMASRPEYFYLAPTGAELETIYRNIAVLIPCPPRAYWGGRGLGPPGGGPTARDVKAHVPRPVPLAH